MKTIAFLILFPFVAALILAFMRKGAPVRKYSLFACCGIIVTAVVYFIVRSLMEGHTVSFLVDTQPLDNMMLVIEWALAALIVYFSFRYKKYYCAVLSVAQTGLITWLELGGYHEVVPAAHIYSDNLTIVMCLIIGVVGCLICVYAMGYMKDYKEHHTEYEDRRSFFFAMLFVFLGAMFGLVFSNNLTWIYFFWEITSVCSFLLIGYSRTDEAIKNSFKALWMNLLGGLGFAIAIVYCALNLHVVDLQSLVTMGSKTVFAIIPVILLAFAGLTKSAQLPFSGWLLGAMVAPTPTSALLHSATMVKAGVYLLLRLSPALEGNIAGLMVTTVGGFTFFATSLLAISQSDSKKVLAYSTVSNLGLITACAGVGVYETVWAGILLMVFHAVSKSLMFLSVGAVENSLGSRNIEDMHGLIIKLPRLAYVMIIGIAGMFLAPFGMLISKWAALKAFVDSDSILLVVFLIFGSATTLFYWTKWLGALVAVHHNSQPIQNITKKSEWFSLACHAVIMVVLCVTFPLLSTYFIEPFLSDMYNTVMPPIISSGNLIIMIMMLVLIAVVPIAAQFLKLGRKRKIVTSYMGGDNIGDDRRFVSSYGQPKQMYLANWYMNDIFGEHKVLNISLILSTAALMIFIATAIGGAI